MVEKLIYVALGGALGSVLRVLVGMAVIFPIGTLIVNVFGSFAIGALWAAGVEKTPGLYPFLMLGLLGGFTTFSTFSLDVMKLLEDAQFGTAFGYVIASVVLSLGACALGIFLFRGAA